MLARLTSAYILWFEYYQLLPKTHRHSLGIKIDALFVESIEAVSIATFLSKEEKLPWIRLAIRKTDTVKVMLGVLWKTKSLSDTRYIALSLKIEEVGKMLGGWNGQISKAMQKK